MQLRFFLFCACVLSTLVLISAYPRGGIPSLARLQAAHRARQPASARKVTYNYETRYFTQVVDHFRYWQYEPQTFQQRYLINTQYWRQPSATEPPGPIFFYTGNEGPIDLFAENTGFMWDIAPEFEAMLVFAEHRYYGESMPFGDNTYSQSSNLVYLSAEQALADYAVLLRQLKQDMNITNAPVIAFGGSYGGMLAAWFRYKYSHVVVGAIASSAPIWQFTGLTPATSYNAIATRDFANAGSYCVPAIRRSWNIMLSMNTPSGLNTLSEIFHLCSPLTSTADIEGPLFNWLSNALATMPMVDYPYPTDFMGPMPAYPVTLACNYFTEGQNDVEILQSLFQAVSVYYNYSNQVPQCFNLSMNLDPTLNDAGGWSYQSCTEMVMPISQDNVNDFFYPSPWNLTAVIESCQAQFNVTPRADWIMTYYGDHALELSAASNIVFPNGNLDPWSGGGVQDSWTQSIVTFLIDGGAHHLDLRSSNPLDPESVIQARNIHKDNIKAWIAQYHGFGAYLRRRRPYSQISN